MLLRKSSYNNIYEVRNGKKNYFYERLLSRIGDVPSTANNDWAQQGYVAVNVPFMHDPSAVATWRSNTHYSLKAVMDAVAADPDIPADMNVIALHGISYGGDQSVVLAARWLTALGSAYDKKVRAVLSESAGYMWWNNLGDQAPSGDWIVPKERPFAIAVQQQLGDTIFLPGQFNAGSAGAKYRANNHKNSGTTNAQRFFSFCAAGGEHDAHPDPAGWNTWRLSAMKYMLHSVFNAPKFAGYVEPASAPSNACAD